MPVIAQIQFVQPGGGGTGTPGWAMVGDLALPVTVHNADDSQVSTSTFEVVDVPPGSAVPTGMVQSGAVKTYAFTPDVRGGYHVHLITTDQFGNFAEDFRVFQVAEASGRIIPPFKADAAAFNFGGQVLGWAPYLDAFLRQVEAGSGFITALDLDFTAQPTQALATDGNFTIGGKTFTKFNSAADSVAMVLTNGSGLVQKPVAASNISSATRTAPGLYITLANAGVPAPYPGQKVRVWARMASQNIAANFDSAFLALEAGAGQLLQYYAYKQWATVLNMGSGITLNSTTTNTAGEVTSVADDVLVIEAEIGAPGYHVYSGVWSAGWPLASALRLRDSIALTGAQVLHVGGVLAWDVLLAAGRAASGTALNVTWGALKVEYRP